MFTILQSPFAVGDLLTQRSTMVVHHDIVDELSNVIATEVERNLTLLANDGGRHDGGTLGRASCDGSRFDWLVYQVYAQ